MKRIISLLMVMAILFSLTVPAMAADDATGTTLRLEETNGTVTVKDAAGKAKTAREGMRLYNGYTISTGASSSAYISLDETKAVKLDSSGKVEIKKSGKKLEVSLTSGQLYFNVTEPLKVDESLNIRTSTMVTGIRGSFGWVTTDKMGLMHGHVTLTCINPETNEVRVTEVYSGEMVRYEQDVSQDIAADPELLEIDFVKEEVTIEDVPAIVAEQVANDETLQAQLVEDETVTIDVVELVESLDDKKAEETAAEETAQVEVEAALVVQEEAIAASISEDAEAGDTAQEYVDLSANVGTPTSGSGNDNSSSGGSYTPPMSSTIVSTEPYPQADLQNALNTYATVIYTGSSASCPALTVPAGKTLIIGNGSYSNLEIAALDNYGTIIVTGGTNTSDSGFIGIHPEAGGVCRNRSSGQIVIQSAAGASISTNTYAYDGTGSFINDGAFTIESGGVVYNSYITTTNNGTIDNYGAFVNNGTLDNYGKINNYAQ